jgi:hypothetical protein
MPLDVRLAVNLSSPKLENLSKPQERFLAALKDRLTGAGLRILPESASTDDVEQRLGAIRQCHGVVVLAFSQWQAARMYRVQEKKSVMPTEFTHLGVSMALAARRPLFLLREKCVAERGALRRGYVSRHIGVPNSLNPEWLESVEFETEFQRWLKEVDRFRHVFLGYSSKATSVGNALRAFLSEKLGLRVFDWHDFELGGTIWNEIERAECYTNCGIFLFMTDDTLSSGKKRESAPRDNVVYEAGYFAGAKGRQRSLIIREKGAHVPTDLGGILYLELDGRSSISQLETKLREHLERMLNPQP